MTIKFNETRLKNVALIRTGDHAVEISWNFSEKPREVAIFSGESPDHIDRRHPAAISREKSSARISGLDPDTRYYFEVAPDRGSKIIISERRVPIGHGGCN